LNIYRFFDVLKIHLRLFSGDDCMEGESIVEVVERVVSGMKDPRVVGRTLHSLSDILVLTLSGVISGIESWEGIVEHVQDRDVRRGFYIKVVGISDFHAGDAPIAHH
jgi:hypothetical protein